MTLFLDTIVSITQDAKRRFKKIEKCDYLCTMFYLLAVHTALFHLSVS